MASPAFKREASIKKTNTKNCISAFYVLQAKCIAGRTIDIPESNSLPIRIFEASLESLFALAGMKLGHADAEEQQD
jgi:hypothetical protein